nr:BTB/POZ domain-containing protein At4g08455 [Ipomoea batatas]
MKCVSCKEEYCSRDAGTCRECYEEASETVEELKSEIKDLKAKIGSGFESPKNQTKIGDEQDDLISEFRDIPLISFAFIFIPLILVSLISLYLPPKTPHFRPDLPRHLLLHSLPLLADIRFNSLFFCSLLNPG